jgi:hypothetical protein
MSFDFNLAFSASVRAHPSLSTRGAIALLDRQRERSRRDYHDPVYIKLSCHWQVGRTAAHCQVSVNQAVTVTSMPSSWKF